MWKSKFYGAFVLNRRVYLHAIDAHSTHWLISTQAPMDSDIVRFRSRGRAGGKHRSLVRTAATPSERQYDLPPLSRVTLERIDEAGSWSEFGRMPQRRLYTVVVEFLA